MNGNVYYRKQKKEVQKTCERINFVISEEEKELIVNYRYWRNYSGATSSTDSKINKGRDLDNKLLNAVISFDFPDLDEDNQGYDENESKQRKIDRAAETREVRYPNYE